MRPSAPTRRDEHDLLGCRARRRSRSCARQRVGQLEDALDVGLLRAGPDDARARAPAEQQVERVREHGLARAGLAGEHVQARRQAQLGALDQQQVLDTQLEQHARRSSSGRRRIARRRAPAL